MDEKKIVEPGSPVEGVAEGSWEDEIDVQAERRVVRKMDLNLISVFGCAPACRRV